MESREKDQYWLNLASNAMTASSSYFDQNVRSRIIRDIRAFQSEHPEGSKYLTDAFALKSRLFRPKTRSAIRKNEAVAAQAYFSTEDVVSVRPQDDSDEMQRTAAEFNKNLLQYRLTKPAPHGIPWFLTCMGAYQEAQVVGVVASHQDWIKGLGRPDVKLVPLENVRFDPAADWRDVVNSSPYIIIQWPMYLRDVKQRMLDGQWRLYRDDEISSSSSQSMDSIRQQREGQGTDSKNVSRAINEFSVVWVNEVIVKVEDIDVVFFTLGQERLLSDPVPVEERYPQGRPIAIGFCVVEAHKAYKSSLPTLTNGMQTEINDVANERRHAVKLSLDKRYIVNKGRGVDLLSLTRNIPASVTMAENHNDVRVVTTDDPTQSAYAEQDRLNSDFDDIVGVFSGSSVATNRALNETVGGMNLISQNATMVSEYQLRTFTETWVEPVLRQLLILEQKFELDAVAMAVAGRSAGLTPELLHDGIYDQLFAQDLLLNVNVGTGTTNPQVQLERFVFAIGTVAKMQPDALEKLDMEEVVKEIFGKCGYKDGKRFFAEKDGAVDPQIEQMKQMIDQLQQRLALKEAPEITGAKVEKLKAETALIGEKTVVEREKAILERIEALYSAMQTAGIVVATPGVAPVADQIARSAGFEDQDAPPIVDQPLAGAMPTALQGGMPTAVDVPANSHPQFPAHADSGMMAGIDGGAL